MAFIVLLFTLALFFEPSFLFGKNKSAFPLLAGCLPSQAHPRKMEGMSQGFIFNAINFIPPMNFFPEKMFFRQGFVTLKA